MTKHFDHFALFVKGAAVQCTNKVVRHHDGYGYYDLDSPGAVTYLDLLCRVDDAVAHCFVPLHRVDL